MPNFANLFFDYSYVKVVSTRSENVCYFFAAVMNDSSMISSIRYLQYCLKSPSSKPYFIVLTVQDKKAISISSLVYC